MFARAWSKLELIETGKARPGSIIIFTPAEIDAWLRTRVPQMFDGVREQKVLLGLNTLTGSALVDFAKVRQSEGESANSVFSKLVEGERPVKVTVSVESGRGVATFHVTKVEISGVALTGSVLEFMFKFFLLPLFPEAHVNEPFELRDNIERLDVRPSGVRVTMKR